MIKFPYYSGNIRYSKAIGYDVFGIEDTQKNIKMLKERGLI